MSESLTKQLCNCLDNECHAAPGWTCRKKALTSKNQTVLRFSAEGMVTKEAIGHFVLASDYDDLCEENQSLRNLADNLRPGPISQALQESPDYSGQTIERLRAALENIRENTMFLSDSTALMCGQIARKALSGDPSAPETKTPERIRLKLAKDVYDDGADHHPPGYIGNKGDVVYLHSIQTAVVSHHGTGHGFVVHDGELEIPSAVETTDELTCEVCGNPLDDHSGIGLECPLPPEYPIPPGEEHDKSKWRAEKASGYQTYPGEPLAGIYEAGVGIVRLGKDDEATGE